MWTVVLPGHQERIVGEYVYPTLPEEVRERWLREGATDANITSRVVNGQVVWTAVLPGRDVRVEGVTRTPELPDDVRERWLADGATADTIRDEIVDGYRVWTARIPGSYVRVEGEAPRIPSLPDNVRNDWLERGATDYTISYSDYERPGYRVWTARMPGEVRRIEGEALTPELPERVLRQWQNQAGGAEVSYTYSDTARPGYRVWTAVIPSRAEQRYTEGGISTLPQHVRDAWIARGATDADIIETLTPDGRYRVWTVNIEGEYIPHYEEPYLFDVPAEVEAWKNAGFNVTHTDSEDGSRRTWNVTFPERTVRYEGEYAFTMPADVQEWKNAGFNVTHTDSEDGSRRTWTVTFPPNTVRYEGEYAFTIPEDVQRWKDAGYDVQVTTQPNGRSRTWRVTFPERTHRYEGKYTFAEPAEVGEWRAAGYNYGYTDSYNEAGQRIRTWTVTFPPQTVHHIGDAGETLDDMTRLIEEENEGAIVTYTDEPDAEGRIVRTWTVAFPDRWSRFVGEYVAPELPYDVYTRWGSEPTPVDTLDVNGRRVRTWTRTGLHGQQPSDYAFGEQLQRMLNPDGTYAVWSSVDGYRAGQTVTDASGRQFTLREITPTRDELLATLSRALPAGQLDIWEAIDGFIDYDYDIVLGDNGQYTQVWTANFEHHIAPTDVDYTIVTHPNVLTRHGSGLAVAALPTWQRQAILGLPVGTPGNLTAVEANASRIWRITPSAINPTDLNNHVRNSTIPNWISGIPGVPAYREFIGATFPVTGTVIDWDASGWSATGISSTRINNLVRALEPAAGEELVNPASPSQITLRHAVNRNQFVTITRRADALGGPNDNTSTNAQLRVDAFKWTQVPGTYTAHRYAWDDAIELPVPQVFEAVAWTWDEDHTAMWLPVITTQGEGRTVVGEGVYRTGDYRRAQVNYRTSDSRYADVNYRTSDSTGAEGRGNNVWQDGWSDSRTIARTQNRTHYESTAVYRYVPGEDLGTHHLSTGVYAYQPGEILDTHRATTSVYEYVPGSDTHAASVTPAMRYVPGAASHTLPHVPVRVPSPPTEPVVTLPETPVTRPAAPANQVPRLTDTGAGTIAVGIGAAVLAAGGAALALSKKEATETA